MINGDKIKKRNKLIARVFGNWGVAFFAPLTGGNVAETIFDAGLSFEQTLLIAFISSLFVLGLTLSKAAEEYGKQK